MTSSPFSKISWLIYQLVNTSESSLIQSFLSSDKEKATWVEVMTRKIEFLLRTSQRWSMTTPLVRSRSSWRRSGFLTTIDGLWLPAMVEPENTWTRCWRQKVIGKLCRLSTTHSISQSWVMPRVKVSERNSSTTWVISIQIEQSNWTTPKISRHLLILSRAPPITRPSKRYLIQSELRSQKLNKSSQSMIARREISPEDTQWLSWDNSTTVPSMHTLSLRSWRSRTSPNLLKSSRLMLSQRITQPGERSLPHSNTMLMQMMMTTDR